MTVHESFHRLAKLYEDITAEQLQAWYGADEFASAKYRVLSHTIQKHWDNDWRKESELRAEIASAEKPTWQQQVVDALEAYGLTDVTITKNGAVNPLGWIIFEDGTVNPDFKPTPMLDIVKEHDHLVDALNAAGLDQYKRIVPKYMPTIEGDAVVFVTPNAIPELRIYRHYKTGVYHRLDGPARFGDSYYIDGEWVDEVDYAEAVAKYKEAHGV